ncbi:MAG: hypothetical protein BAJALOKI3v1_510024 [Promethearchaeota archaeon]|jgi:hypothetical protein|nr:MAG: hypothetical protein BAJALOKI3v1_510024 [Candidatus Lokiarchaeota archaeon]
MESEKSKDAQKNKISVGLIIDKEELQSNVIFPGEIKEEVMDAPFYLLIFISREDVVKISCFPSTTNNIKKILIKLEEFSPNLVKGISSVLRELNLSKDVLHTTGLCYELSDCYYESFITGDGMDSEDIEEIKRAFMAIEKVNDVIFEEVELLS